MADQPVEVLVQIGSQDVLAGRLWSHRRRGTESMTFAYEDAYISTPGVYALDPQQLPLHVGPQQTPQGVAIFGALSDAAPDRWGRELIQRRESKEAKSETRARRAFGEIDFLLGVRDDLRQGALRFRHQGSELYLASDVTGIPVLTNLPELLTAAHNIEQNSETPEELRLLTKAGSSLGGARPKAHVLARDGRLSIAKFPSGDDGKRDVMRWERVALRLARDAGIRVPDNELVSIGNKWVLIVNRFDRAAGRRIGYVSAMTMLGLADGESASYLDIAQVITEQSPHATDDLRELWRRMAFSILISNDDDHLRNHGFVRTSTSGWSLSPAFDLNPNPHSQRELSTALDWDDYRADIHLLLSVAEAFRLDENQALGVLGEVCQATDRWRDVAASVGLDGDQIEQMEPAFEHESSTAARSLTTSHA
jgi:serine/threonine-protein kinase HipA